MTILFRANTFCHHLSYDWKRFADFEYVNDDSVGERIQR